ncbi:FkbM family methyltransferase [Kibdelosporangium aridum]|uniref:FkbM family methyltransferase n=1 Tax=Kibdelosporangium aridum TaxID=2030 RepID=UPI0035E562C7
MYKELISVSDIEANTLTGFLAYWARTEPDAIALQCRGETLTFHDLDAAAQRVADHIHARGGEPGEIVALAVPRSLGSVIAILGVLKAGCAYVPLEVDDRAGRNTDIVERTKPVLVIAENPFVADEAGVPVLLLNDCTLPVARAAPPAISGATLAYVMPTSGTGGALKLVRISHGNVVYNVHALAAAVGEVSSEDVYLHYASFSFSSSVRQLFLPLSCGARIIIAVGEERLDPEETLHLMRRSGVTIADLIPSVLSGVVDVLETCEQSRLVGLRLRLLLLASERLRGALVTRWANAWSGPHVDLRNMYGQTETAGIVAVHMVDETTEQPTTVPVGWPINGTNILVVDESLRPVPTGTIGEIIVFGGGQSSGYHGDEELTEQTFPILDLAPGVRDRGYRTGDLGRMTELGIVEFIGRADSQIKVHGYKVDLAEVERLLESHNAVAEAVAANTAAENQDVRVQAFVRCAGGYVDAALHQRVRHLANGLRILDLNPPETDFMYDEIFVREVYQQGGVEIPRKACVIDAGANIGLFTLFVATNYPDATVYAFELAAPIASTLKTNLAVNSCTNVLVRPYGLSNRSGPATLTFYPHSAGMSSVHASRDEEQATLSTIISNQLRRGEVPDGAELREFAIDLAEAKLVEHQLECTLTRLSDVLDAEGITDVDLLKIDVQKSELDLLRGVRDEHWPLIKQIVLEVHDLDGRLNVVLAELTARGYSTTVKQDALFDGSDLYYVYARRSSARLAAPRTTNQQRFEPIPVTGTELRKFLTQRLPSHHIPDSIRILPDFPRTLSGKIDRTAITAIDSAPSITGSEPMDPGSDPWIAEILSVVTEVLKKPIAPSDDFFDVGGNSISAARVITRIRDRYTAQIKIGLIFTYPQLDLFAAKVREILDKAS